MFFPKDLCMAAFIQRDRFLLVAQFILLLHPNNICSLELQGKLFPRCEQGLKTLAILSFVDDEMYKSNQDHMGPRAEGLHTVLYVRNIFFLFTGYFQSSVTTVWRGGPLQCQSTGAAQDHQPPCAAAKTTVLSLSEKWPECKASTFYTLCNLWFHCQGQLLL